MELNITNILSSASDVYIPLLILHGDNPELFLLSLEFKAAIILSKENAINSNTISFLLYSHADILENFGYRIQSQLYRNYAKYALTLNDATK